MAEFTVDNVVGKIVYQQELELSALAETFEVREEITSVTYEPAENHWVQARFAPDDSYVAFYRSGSCSIAGAQSVQHFQEIASRVNDVMKDLLEFEYEPETEVTNIVATADIGSNIPLEVFAIELGLDRVEYEPEQFPAIVYRAEDYVMLVFASGKLLCTGLTDLNHISDSFDEMASRIQSIV